jgi:ClpP class serine protease
VNGVSELSNMVYAARGKKPVVAYASGDAASGAYWIASAADEIVVSDTSALGSIGVVGMYRGKSGKQGEDVEIVSSQSPHKRLDPQVMKGGRVYRCTSTAWPMCLLAPLPATAMSVRKCSNHYGGGDVLIGAKAVQAGLADRVGSLEQLIQELSTSSQSPPLEGFFVTKTPTVKQEKKPMDLETLTKEHPGLVTQIKQEGAKC